MPSKPTDQEVYWGEEKPVQRVRGCATDFRTLLRHRVKNAENGARAGVREGLIVQKEEELKKKDARSC